MGLRHRVRKLEGQGSGAVVILVGLLSESWREEVADARRRGLPVTVVRVVMTMVAKSAEDAEAMLARHCAECPQFAAAVYPDGEVLAEYEAECPAELRDILAVGG